MNNSKLWVVGPDKMAKEYIKVLTDVLVIARAEKNCQAINELCEITKAKNGFND